jgi:FtsP/CotA-like multicopper oxidase with cupredoxin domain
MMMFAFANQSSTFTSGWNELFNSQTEALAQPLQRSQPSPLDGMNFSKPQDVYSKDGVLQTAISVDYQMGKVDNKPIISMVYNGSLPGPALHVYPGDRVEIDLINNLNESTNLHFHGLHVSPGNILSIFRKITLQVRYGIIHICIIFLMDKFRQVCLACLLLKG